MFGSIKKYTKKRKDKEGRVTSVQTVWRARYPDPDGVKATDQIERVFKSKAEAREWLAEESAKVRRGEHTPPRLGKQSFAAVADEWKRTWVDLEPKTRDGYKSLLSCHVLPAFGHRKVGAISPAEVQRFIEELHDGKGLAPNTIRRVIDVTRNVLRVAVERRYIATNPCDAIKLPKKGRGRNIEIDPLTGAELNKLVEALPAHWRLPILLAAYTGLRAGELWALRRNDIRVGAAELVVDEAIKEVTTSEAANVPAKMRLTPSLIVGDTKTHAQRVVSVPPFLREQLISHLARSLPGGDGPSAFIFTTPTGEPVRHNLFYKRVFVPAIKAAFPGRCFRFHDLRHTCAAWLIEDGAHPLQIKLRLGHEDIKTTMNTYGHLFPSAEAALGDLLDARFRRAQTEPEKVVTLAR